MKLVKTASCFLLLLSIIYLMQSCSNEDGMPITQDHIETSIYDLPEVILNDVSIGGVALPIGTTVEKVSEGKVNFVYPNGIFEIRKDGDNGVSYHSKKSYTCTGDCETGCDVIYFDGTFGCSACSPSTETCSGKAGGGNENSRIEESFIEFLDVNAPITLLSSAKGLTKLSCLPKGILDLEGVNQKLESFYQDNFNEGFILSDDLDRNTDDYGLAPLNVFGYAMMAVVPKAKSSISIREVLQKTDVSCSCGSGNAGCILKKIKKGFVVVGYKCQAAGCTSCTMTVEE